LAAARSLEGPAVFAEVERATRRFLADRVGVPAAALPADALDAALARAAVPDDLRHRTRALLDAATRGQFAPGLGPAPSAVVDEAAATLDALDALYLPA